MTHLQPTSNNLASTVLLHSSINILAKPHSCSGPSHLPAPGFETIRELVKTSAKRVQQRATGSGSDNSTGTLKSVFKVALPPFATHFDTMDFVDILCPTAASQRKLLPTRPANSQAPSHRPLRQPVAFWPSRMIRRLLRKKPRQQTRPATFIAIDFQPDEELDYPNGRRSYGASPAAIWRAETNELFNMSAPQMSNQTSYQPKAYHGILDYVKHRRKVKMGLVPDDEGEDQDEGFVEHTSEKSEERVAMPALVQADQPILDFTGVASIEDVRNRYIEFAKREMRQHKRLLRNATNSEFSFITGMSGRHQDDWARALTVAVLYPGKLMLAKKMYSSRRLKSVSKRRYTKPGPTPLRESASAGYVVVEPETSGAAMVAKRKRESDTPSESSRLSADDQEAEDPSCLSPPGKRLCVRSIRELQETHFVEAHEELEADPHPSAWPLSPTCNDMSIDQLITRFFDLVTEQGIDTEAVMGLGLDKPLEPISALRYLN